MGALTAARAGLQACLACGQLCQLGDAQHMHCPRCGAPVTSRKPDSIRRTWAWLLAGYVMYVPANLLPIMETRSIQESQVDTILSGVIYLWKTGSWGLALIVFTASVMVPSFKLLGLSWLN